jgi:long-chain acyl-CoA synthetase
MPEADTLPKFLVRNYQKYGTKRVTVRQKDFGIWNRYTWQDYYENVKYLALGLLSLGLERNDKVTIIGENAPEWFWAEYAVQAAGGVPSGIFTDSIPSEVSYIVKHSGSRFVLAEDQEQVDKFLKLKAEDGLEFKNIIYWDPKGLNNYDDPALLSYKRVQELGKEYEKQHPGLFEQKIEQGKPEDISVILYTSGTTGLPKGAMLTQGSLVAAGKMWMWMDPWYETDEYVSFISPAWATEQFYGVSAGLQSGARINFPEEPETVQENIREVGPQTVMFGPRLWEDITSRVQAKMIDATFLNRLIYSLCLPVGYKRADLQAVRKKPGLYWKALFRIADLAVFRPIRDSVGLMKVRSAFTGGAPLNAESFRLLRALGINLKQFYGLTETGGVTMHEEDGVRYDTVGKCVKGMEIRITDEGEILARGASVFVGYYKNPEVTAEKLRDGWFHTGDAGYFDDDGQLVFLGRVKDLVAVGGHMVSPEHIEGRLKFSPFIKDAMVIGGMERPYLTALVQIDFENVGRWAEKNKLPYTTFTDLSQKPEVYKLTLEHVNRINRILPSYSQVRRYSHLHKQFDADEAELTRTRKLRRQFINDRYKGLIDAMYTDNSLYKVETEVKYRDGRKGTMETAITIQSPKVKEGD